MTVNTASNTATQVNNAGPDEVLGPSPARPGTGHNDAVSTESEPPRLLLVEDDQRLLALLTRLLSGAGYRVETAVDGQHGLHLGLSRRYDVMLLDRRLPAIDGLDVLARLRAKGTLTPTLVLSAMNDPAHRVAGLDAGAEDYLGKPFDVDELLARLRALRRRHLDLARRLPLPGGTLDLDTRQVAIASRPLIRLSRRECALLETLAMRPRKVFSREELRVLAFDDAGTEVVETYVHYLRRKLGPDMVDTVRGRGYQLGAIR